MSIPTLLCLRFAIELYIVIYNIIVDKFIILVRSIDLSGHNLPYSTLLRLRHDGMKSSCESSYVYVLNGLMVPGGRQGRIK